MISVLITSRVEGNPNHGLLELLESLQENTFCPEDLEVLVKFDEDDLDAYSLQAQLLENDYDFVVKYCRGPRGRGYIDIHHGYNQLLPMVSQHTQIVGAMADDFTVNPNWDSFIMEAGIAAQSDYFVIHQRPHPRRFWPLKQDGKENYDVPDKFCMKDDMFDSANLHIIDEAPFWSRELLKACKYAELRIGGFPEPDFVFPVSFTDAWTVCLEYVLWHDHQKSITQFLPDVFINRKTCEVDQPGNPRWNGDRQTNFDYVKSQNFKDIVCQQAKEIACLL